MPKSLLIRELKDDIHQVLTQQPDSYSRQKKESFMKKIEKETRILQKPTPIPAYSNSLIWHI